MCAVYDPWQWGLALGYGNERLHAFSNSSRFLFLGPGEGSVLRPGGKGYNVHDEYMHTVKNIKFGKGGIPLSVSSQFRFKVIGITQNYKPDPTMESLAFLMTISNTIYESCRLISDLNMRNFLTSTVHFQTIILFLSVSAFSS